MKELQNGRSMIEMLGVLAIIGVLSIGGLAGYTMAMNRHRANEILDAAAKCGVIAQTSGLNGDEIDGDDCFGTSYLNRTDTPSGLDTMKVYRAANGEDTYVEVKFSSSNVENAFTNRTGTGALSGNTAYLDMDENGKWTKDQPTTHNTISAGS